MTGYLQCNDGNTVAADGCTNCMIDATYSCSVSDSVAVPAVASVCNKTCGN